MQTFFKTGNLESNGKTIHVIHDQIPGYHKFPGQLTPIKSNAALVPAPFETRGNANHHTQPLTWTALRSVFFSWWKSHEPGTYCLGSV